MLLIPVILAVTAATEPVLAPQPVPPASSYSPVSAPALRRAADGEFKMGYTFIEVSYFSTDIDAIDESTDGYGARAQLGLFDFLYAFVGYAAEDVDFDGESADTDTFELGVGAHFDLAGDLDLVGEASWLYDDASSDTISDLDDSNSGYTIFLGGRGMALKHASGGLELNGGFRWIDRESALLSDDSVGAWEAGARYHFAHHFSIGVGYQFLEDDSRWNGSLRFQF